MTVVSFWWQNHCDGARPWKSLYRVLITWFPVHFAGQSVIRARKSEIWLNLSWFEAQSLSNRLASDNQSFNHHMMSCKNDRSVELDHFDMVYYRLDRARPVSLSPSMSLKNFLIKLNLIIWSLAKLLETMVSTFYIFPGLSSLWMIVYDAFNQKLIFKRKGFV